MRNKGVFMKKINIALVIIAMLFAGATSYANTFYIYGWVIDKTTQQGIPEVTLSNSFLGTATTNGSGRYEFIYHNFCGYKRVKIEKTGYITRYVDFWDNSCPECTPGYDPDNPPSPPPPPCGTVLMKNVELTRSVTDGDVDGILNAYDNCIDIANGPAKGTCRSGSLKGRTCYNQNQCGCGSPPMSCSMSQEDMDSDGAGDVCDSTPSGASLNSQAMTSSTMHQGLIAFWVINFCINNNCEYGCLQQLIEDVSNGPDYMFGRPTRPDSGEHADCPDLVTFVDWVNQYLFDMWDHFYGGNFPDEGMKD